MTRWNPQVGDRRTIKGVPHIRMMTVVHDPVTKKVIGYNCTGGYQNYHWAPLTPELDKKHPDPKRPA